MYVIEAHAVVQCYSMEHMPYIYYCKKYVQSKSLIRLIFLFTYSLQNKFYLVFLEVISFEYLQKC